MCNPSPSPWSCSLTHRSGCVPGLLDLISPGPPSRLAVRVEQARLSFMSSVDDGWPCRTSQEHTIVDNIEHWGWMSDWKAPISSRASLHTRIDARQQQHSSIDIIAEPTQPMGMDSDSTYILASSSTNGASLRRRKHSTYGHRRATTSGGSPEPPAHLSHPLERSASASSSKASASRAIDLGVTRPTLRRRMSSPVGERPRRSSIPKDISGIGISGPHAYPFRSKDEMDVIVHKVCHSIVYSSHLKCLNTRFLQLTRWLVLLLSMAFLLLIFEEPISYGHRILYI